MPPDPQDFSSRDGGWIDGDSVDPATALVLEANQAFYDAFEAADLNAMSDLWVHEDRALCVHPGWTALRGWASIASSWAVMFDGPQQIQFIVTDEHVSISGDTAWVSCDENLLTTGASATVNALNIFERTDGMWKMVAHHGAPVMVASDDSFENDSFDD